LKYSAKSLDRSLVRIGINPEDTSLVLFFAPNGKEGRTNIVLSASDGPNYVTDTFSVVVKEPLVLRDRIKDTSVITGLSPRFIIQDISNILPDLSLVSTEYQTFSASSSDTTLISIQSDNETNTLFLEAIDSGLGEATIVVTIIDSDQFSVSDTFVVSLTPEIEKPQSERLTVTFNPGISMFSGIDHSGVLFKFWINDFIGGALSGYYEWDHNGIGTELQLLVKPSFDFPLHPYGMIGSGYHRETIRNLLPEQRTLVRQNLDLWVLRAAGGVDFWLGKSKWNVLGLEAGYCYGKKEYNTMGIGDAPKDGSFEMAPLYVRVSFTFYFKKL